MECTALIKRVDSWWIGWIEEVPGVNCQGKTREGLIEALRETLKEALELAQNSARGIAGSDYEEEIITI